MGAYAAAALRRDPVPPLETVARVPGWFNDAVMAMLALDRHGRPSAAECVRLLSQPVTTPSHGHARPVLPQTQTATPPQARPTPLPRDVTPETFFGVQPAPSSISQVAPSRVTGTLGVEPAGSAARPASIRAASTLMLIGAALAAISAISVLFGFGFAYHYAGSLLFRTYGAGRPSFVSAPLPGCLYYAIECALWLWGAAAVSRGNSWTRIASIAVAAGLVVQVIAFHFFPRDLSNFTHPFMFVGGYSAEYIALDTLSGLLSVLIVATGIAVAATLLLSPSRQYFRLAPQPYRV